VRVTALDFKGVSAFDSSTLHKILATRQSGKLPWSPQHYFDRTAFESDLKRLTAFYADRGYPHARVTSVGVNLSPDRKSVRLSITIDEGRRDRRPGSIRRLRDLPADAALAHVATDSPGARRDRDLVRQTRDQPCGSSQQRISPRRD
jgi:outer membrane translocation and assembly module TamA